MASTRVKRMRKELQEIAADEESEIKVTEQGDDIMHLRGSFPGPPGTPYEGGTYVIDVTIPDGYPFKAPIMKFVTKIWHPNVSSQTGAICLDTLGSAWTPVLNVKTGLLSLQSLLSTPEPNDPQDAEVAKMLKERPKEFERVAAEWAHKYAGAPERERGESSNGATEESLRAATKAARADRETARLAAYGGYNRQMIDGFVAMGFQVSDVVDAFNHVGIDSNNGEFYEMEEAYIGDITARLFNEP